ncbi:bifunctional riboflavin kinase/FAD synthetase [bacterium]|nr:bifunctional riboflavin kinase/FAD synthetase [bacterium]
MQLIKDINKLMKLPSSVTIGTFDGVHVGHRKIISQLKGYNKNLRNVVVTFEPHPQTVLHPTRPEIYILTTLEEKAAIFESLGVDVLFVVKFDEQMASKTGEEFVKEILINAIGMKHCVIGHDHAFGKNRSGNYQTLMELSKSLEFTVDRVEAFEQSDIIVNSTTIRKFLSGGDVNRAADLLGKYYTMSGLVIRGDGRGRTIGIPTANLQIDHPKKLIPRNGVYATRLILNEKKFPAVTNIGTRPTYNGQSVSIETHILNFDKDIYDRPIQLEFSNRIRDEKKFASPDELVAAIRLDIDVAIKQGLTNI